MDLISISDEARFTERNTWDDDGDDDDRGFDGAELLAAAEEGLGADNVLSILVKNPGITRTCDPVGNTVLHMAARDGNIGTVRNLIAFVEERQDEDLKKVFKDQNVDGDTALHLALKNGHQEVAYYLIKAEKHTRHVRNNARMYPYDLAKEAGYSEVCELAIIKEVVPTARADVEMRAIQADLMSSNRSVAVCWNELYRAIKKGDMLVLVTGLKQGDKELLRHQDHLGETLLHAAVTACRSELVWILIHHMMCYGMTDVARMGNRNGDTPLLQAVRKGNVSATQCLIMVEPKTIYQVNHQGVSPLYMAVRDTLTTETCHSSTSHHQN